MNFEKISASKLISWLLVAEKPGRKVKGQSYVAKLHAQTDSGTRSVSTSRVPLCNREYPCLSVEKRT